MKRVLRGFIAIVLLFSLAPCIKNEVSAKTESKLKDVNANTETGQAIYAMVERGILSGYSDGTFKPNKPVTNAQAAKMIAGALNFTYDELPNPYYEDVPETHSNYPYIMALMDTGIFLSKTAYKFKPNEPLKRIRMAEILTRAYHLPDPTYGKVEMPFTDLKTDDERRVVAPLYLNGVTKGTKATTFGKSQAVTRGQFATFIYRIEQKIAKGELTGRQPVLNAFVSKDYTLVDLKDDKGNVISSNDYVLLGYVGNLNILIYESDKLGKYVATFKNLQGSPYEMAIKTDYYNNNFTNYTGDLRVSNPFIYQEYEIKGDVNEFDEGTFELLSVNATVAPAIHKNYSNTVKVDYLPEEQTGGVLIPRFTVLEEGRTIIQYTYKINGVTKTKNVYYATGFIGDRPFISRIKTQY